jgi:Tfp pilus assembly protein PilP
VRARIVATIVVASAAARVDAQQAPAPIAEKPPLENYTYQPEGRRDPFVSLLGTGSEPRSRTVARKGDGPAAFTISEISVRGVLESRGSLIAIIAGPDNKTYVVHPGDKLLDATITSITAQGLVLVRDVRDLSSSVKQREIHKLLQSLEGSK